MTDTDLKTEDDPDRLRHIEAALGADKLHETKRYSPEFTLEDATNKYLARLPLARQVRRMKRQGLEVTTQIPMGPDRLSRRPY